MGYTTQEFSSKALSKLYPSFYQETQVHNWTPVDIVITKHDGTQTVLPAWPMSSSNHKPTVEITSREVSGMRTKQVGKGRVEDVELPAKKHMVKYEDFILYPVKVTELGIIISTKEQSLIAKNMIAESNYHVDSTEYLSDFETKDPRFVFEVKDPFNRWSELYVYAMGQTITLRCGHSANIIADIDETRMHALEEECVLSCYLRYPTNCIQSDSGTVPVFTINLKDLDLEEPYRLPSGDIVCVASSLEALQRVIDKKHSSHASTGVQIVGMITKEVHEQALANLKNELDRAKKDAAEQLRSERMSAQAERAAVKLELDEEKRKSGSLKQQLDYWSALHKSTVERLDREDKLYSGREKIRAEVNENARRELDNLYTALKIGGAVITGIASFALTIWIKSNKGK